MDREDEPVFWGWQTLGREVPGACRFVGLQACPRRLSCTACMWQTDKLVSCLIKAMIAWDFLL